MNRFLVILSITIITISCSDKNRKNSTTNEADRDKEIISTEEVKDDLKSFEIPGTEVHSLISTINKKTYELYVKLPKSYSNSEEQYPVLILTDADYSFPLVTSIARRVNTDEFIIVGISYLKRIRPELAEPGIIHIPTPLMSHADILKNQD